MTERKLPTGVKKIGPRKYQATYRDPNGKEKSRTFTASEAADRWRREKLTAIDHGAYVDPASGRVTFEQYSERWLAEQVFREQTIDRVESNIRVHMNPTFGHRRMASIQPSDVQSWVKRLSQTHAPNSVKVIFGQLCWIMRAAVVDHVIASTPCPARAIKLPKVTRPQVVPLEIEAVERLRDHAQDHLRALIMVAAGSGLRGGELVGLTVDRVDFLRRTIRVDRQLVTPKSGPPKFGPPKTEASMRSVPVPKVVIDAIAEHLARFPSDGLVFKNSHGEPWRRRSFLLAFARAVKLAELPNTVTCHGLRHFYASLLIRHGESVKTIQSRLGHASAMETLNTYSHLWPDADDRTRDAVEHAFAERSRTTRGLAVG